MTDTDYMSTPLPARPVHNIPPLGQDASEGDNLVPVRPQDSNMSIGPGIQLEGEISNCATLVVEGEVEVTLDGEALEINQRGVFCGTARVKSAFIHGRFEGDLTVSGLLRVANGGSATGKLRYGQLDVAEGAELSGEISKYIGENGKSAADDSVGFTDKAGRAPTSAAKRRKLSLTGVKTLGEETDE